MPESAVLAGMLTSRVPTTLTVPSLAVTAGRGPGTDGDRQYFQCPGQAVSGHCVDHSDTYNYKNSYKYPYLTP